MNKEKIIEKVKEITDLSLEKTYVTIERICQKLPEKYSVFVDRKMKKLKSLSSNRQKAVVFGGLGGIFLLMYFVTCSGPSSPSSDIEKIIAAQEANQKEYQKKLEQERLEEEKARLERNKKEEADKILASNKDWEKYVLNFVKNAVFSNSSLAKDSAIRNVDEEIEKAKDRGVKSPEETFRKLWKKSIEECDEALVLSFVAHDILSDGKYGKKLRKIVGADKKYGWELLEKSAGLATSLKELEEISFNNLPDIPENVMKAFAERGSDYAMKKYLEVLIKESTDSASEWLKECLKKNSLNRVGFFVKLIELFDKSKVAQEYLENFPEDKDLGLAIKKTKYQGDFVDFSRKIRKGDEVDLLYYTKSILRCPKDSSGIGSGKHFLGEVKDPSKEISFSHSSSNISTNSHEKMMAYLIEKEKKGDAVAQRILDVYSIVRGKFVEDIPFFQARVMGFLLKEAQKTGDLTKLIKEVQKNEVLKEDVYVFESSSSRENLEYSLAPLEPSLNLIVHSLSDLKKVASKENDFLLLELTMCTNESIPEGLRKKIGSEVLASILKNETAFFEIAANSRSRLPNSQKNLYKMLQMFLSLNIEALDKMADESSVLKKFAFINKYLLEGDKESASKSIVQLFNITEKYDALSALVLLSEDKDFFSLVQGIYEKRKSYHWKNNIALEALENLKYFTDMIFSKGKRKDSAQSYFLSSPRNPIHLMFSFKVRLAALSGLIGAQYVETFPRLIWRPYLEAVKAFSKDNLSYYGGECFWEAENDFITAFFSRLKIKIPFNEKEVDISEFHDQISALDNGRKSYKPHLRIAELCIKNFKSNTAAKVYLDRVEEKGLPEEKSKAKALKERL